MNTYTVTFLDHDGDTCEVNQPALTAIGAVSAVHTGYGHLAWRPYRALGVTAWWIDTDTVFYGVAYSHQRTVSSVGYRVVNNGTPEFTGHLADTARGEG
jgi:hypothetical protein